MPQQRRRPNLAGLLFQVFQGVQRELIEETRAAGHPAIRPKHGAVLANIDPDGTRASVLALRAGITKPSMHELVDELVREGYVERRPDALDGRAKVVVPTDRAASAVAVAEQAIARVERRCEQLVGTQRFAELRSTLELLRQAMATGSEVDQPRLDDRHQRTDAPSGKVGPSHL